MTKFTYKFLVPVLSRLPEFVLRFLSRKFPVMVDPSGMWNLWLDASYVKYVRNDSKRAN